MVNYPLVSPEPLAVHRKRTKLSEPDCSPHPVTDLPCDQDYVFRVSAYGDGKKYRADYGPAREVSQYTPIDTRSTRSASGSFLCTKPDVTVIPQPERKIKLKWDELGLGPGIGPEYTYKVQAIKNEGNFAIDEMTPEIGSAGTATFREIDLDNIIGGDGLADHTKGYLIRVTATVGTQTGYTELIIIDTPHPEGAWKQYRVGEYSWGSDPHLDGRSYCGGRYGLRPCEWQVHLQRPQAWELPGRPSPHKA